MCITRKYFIVQQELQKKKKEISVYKTQTRLRKRLEKGKPSNKNEPSFVIYSTPDANEEEVTMAIDQDHFFDDDYPTSPMDQDNSRMESTESLNNMATFEFSDEDSENSDDSEDEEPRVDNQFHVEYTT